MKKTFATPLIPISWGELIDKISFANHISKQKLSITHFLWVTIQKN